MPRFPTVVVDVLVIVVDVLLGVDVLVVVLVVVFVQVVVVVLLLYLCWRQPIISRGFYKAGIVLAQHTFTQKLLNVTDI